MSEYPKVVQPIFARGNSCWREVGGCETLDSASVWKRIASCSKDNKEKDTKLKKFFSN